MESSSSSKTDNFIDFFRPYETFPRLSHNLIVNSMINSRSSVNGFYANHFIELEKISQGGFGTVYKARDRLDFQVYAVKKIRIHPDVDAESFAKVDFLTSSSGDSHLLTVG